MREPTSILGGAMLNFSRTTKRGAMIAVGVASIGVGIGLVWIALHPAVTPLVGTGRLASLLGLLVLPGVVLAAWLADRTASMPRTRAGRGDSTPAITVDIVPLAKPQPVESPRARVVRPEREDAGRGVIPGRLEIEPVRGDVRGARGTSSAHVEQRGA